MQENNYQNLKIQRKTKQSESNKSVAKVYLITTEKQIEKFSLKSVLMEKLKLAVKEKSSTIIPLFGNQQHFLMLLGIVADEEGYRNAGALLYQTLAKEKVNIADLKGLKTLDDAQRFAFLEGMLLASYQFDQHKKQENKHLVNILISETAIAEDRLQELISLAAVTAFAKTLVNQPLNQLNAVEFGEVIAEAGKKYGFKTEILHKKQIEALKMGGLLAVNKGSLTPPTFNILIYKPKNAVNTNPLVLVGKGVMYDTGGYSLKTGGSMTGMKCDMGGGAAVLGTIAAIAANKLPYHVVGLIPATDNKISADALVVDDIITMMDGTTVEVQNTDAEGRLILADALVYAKKYNPELVIDLATLTGASAAITGPYGIAMAGNTQQQMDELKEAGENTYERLMQLPFWKEFENLIKSDIADLKNIGGAVGGASTAGKFLEHFTDYDWIHLDIAGAAFIKEAKGYKQIGATAVGVRLLYNFIQKRCQIKD